MQQPILCPPNVAIEGKLCSDANFSVMNRNFFTVISDSGLVLVQVLPARMVPTLMRQTVTTPICMLMSNLHSGQSFMVQNIT